MNAILQSAAGTAIGDTYAREDGRGFAVPNLYTRSTRTYSRLRSGALVRGEYYRSESDPKVLRFDGAKLVYEAAMPRRAAVILVPDDAFEALRRQYFPH